MQEHKPLTRERIAERVIGDPLLSDFLAPFPNLLNRDQTNITASFEGMAKLLARGRKAVRIQFTISDGNDVRCWNLALTPKSCKASEGKYKSPQLEILTQADTWLKIATGQLSPLEAFGQGKLRVRGDITLARFVARKLRDAKETR